MKKITYILVIIFLVQSCDISKRALKSKEARKVTEQTETITKRIGDTVSFVIPNITYKDTTIITKNYVTGTTQVVRYDDRGQIDLVQCLSGAIEEITRSNRELVEAIKNKDSEKTEEFDSSFIIYIMLGLGLIAFIAFFFMYKLLSQNTAILNKIS